MASAETVRARAYTRMYWAKEVPILRAAGLREDMTVLELGSGDGIVTDLLLRTFPGMATTSVELRGEAVARARSYLKDRGHRKAQVIQADALETGLPGGGFDFVYARLLFRYLPDPLGVLREALRLLRPGASLVVSDIDLGLWGFFDPPLPEVKPALEAYERMVASRGGDARIGRKLGTLITKAGFLGARMDAVAATSDDLQEGMSMETFLAPIGRGRLRRMAQRGWLSKDALNVTLAGWTRFLRSDHPFALKVMLMGHGTKSKRP
ncbi:MAG: methyltransferase domain-containing protein [Thermoplasmata archaeon]|nr:methyltransferase domain-containing protein [Thermoplasmata archaeon]